MQLSSAILSGACTDPSVFPLRRYGYHGALDDLDAVAYWLRDHPLADTDWSPPTTPGRRETQVRRDQAAFRKLVGDAYGWRCAITGDGDRCTLEAAHLHKRTWRLHNTVNDGILMRVDLHRLFDAEKLFIGPDRIVHVISCGRQELEGLRIRLPRNRSDWPALHRQESRG
jgi:hypothetical protein